MVSRSREFRHGSGAEPLFPYDPLKHVPPPENRDPDYTAGESGHLHNIFFQLADGTQVHRSKFRKVTRGE